MGSAAQTGCYHLLYHLPAPARVRVGSLGTFDLPAGWYVYTGSAFGPGGLAARVARHRARARNVTDPAGEGLPPSAGTTHPHWHVDYLAAAADLVDVAALPGEERLECEHARTIGALAGASVPVPRFGASDCRCPAHLACFTERPSLGSRHTAHG